MPRPLTIRFRPTLVAALAAGLLLATGGALARDNRRCAADYWVSLRGDDAAAGDRAHPFRSLLRARDAVRADPRRQRCAVTVNLGAGEYRLDSPLVLDFRDSGAPGRAVTWRAAAGARPVLSGSIPVTGWELHDPVHGIYRAAVDPGLAARPALRQLYVNGTRAVRARSALDPSGFERTDFGYRFLAPGQPLPTWGNSGTVEAVTVPQWKMMRCPVAARIGPDVIMRERCWQNANVFTATTGPSLWNFRQLAWLENAREFLDEPGEWYLDAAAGWLYYLPRPGEDLATARVELPVHEALLVGDGSLWQPVTDLRFEGITFAYATWLGPSTEEGYAADQSGFHLTGKGHLPNTIGHDPHDTRTPGNVRFRYAQRIEFRGNAFTHLGGAALDFDTGSQFNVIADNEFEDLSSAAIQLGGITEADHHPAHPQQVTRDNLVTNNRLRFTGREYWDTAAIYVGFTTRTTVSHNDISDVPWSGIAIGWGWGLLDRGAFPGLPGATQDMWGQWDTASTSRGNRIVHNRIERFLQEVWDGGAIYSQGAQGSSLADGELIAWNVATGKRKAAGGNAFYTDGGSRYVTLLGNVSLDNPPGVTDFGPCGLPAALPWCAFGVSSPVPGDPDRCSSLPACWVVIPYGGDSGGCVPHGDLLFYGNYWASSEFSTVCTLERTGPLLYVDNHVALTAADVPAWILRQAGRQSSGRARQLD